jgi:hypothetical protein
VESTYIAANDLPTGIFEGLIALWEKATSSSDAFRRETASISRSAETEGILAAIASGTGRSLVVLSASEWSHSLLRTDYRLVVDNPASSDFNYGVIVSRRLGGTFRISAIDGALH